MRRMFAAGVAMLAVAACERAQAPAAPEPEVSEAPTAAATPAVALAGYRHDLSLDPSGYFLPLTQVQAGVWRLHHLALSDAGGMTEWEDGQRTETFAPVMFVFDDMASPTETNELGGEYHTVTARVLPDAYDVTDAKVRFRGRAPGVGLVTFEGTLDADALEQAQRSLGGGEGPVLNGTLRIGDRVFEGQRFRWWMGD